MIHPFRSRRARLAVVSIVFAACGGDDPVSVRPSRIEITPESPAVHVGETLRLRARVMSNDGRTLTGRSVHWESLDPDVATIDSDGDLLGVAVGDATIRATSDPASATIEISVSPGPHIQLSTTTLELTAPGSSTASVEQTVAITNGGGGRLGGLGVGIAYADGASADWLSVALSDTAAPAEVTLAASPGTLAAGTYQASVQVSSPHADNSPAAVDVRFVVTGTQPGIALAQTRVSFAAPHGGEDPEPATVDVTNSGDGTLSGLTSTIAYADRQPTGWLVATIADTAPATLALQASLGTLAPGVYTGTVSVASPVAQNSPQDVTVTFSVGAPVARIALDVDSLTFTATQDGTDPAVQRVAITNDGTAPVTGLGTSVTYHDEEDGWLLRGLSASTAPSTLSISANIDSLAAGTYTATVHVTSGVAVNSPQPVHVTLEIAPPAASVALSDSSISFAATTETDPAAQQVTITNSGGGTLGGLASAITHVSGQPTGWLSATLGGTTAPATLTLGVASDPLPAGSYGARVRITSTDAANAPEIVVNLTVAATAPTAPTIVTSSVISQSQINLTWSGAAGTIHEYRLERRTGASAYAEIQVLPPTVTSYSDSNLASGTAYTYRLRACNAIGCSDYSAETSVTTLPYPGT